MTQSTTRYDARLMEIRRTFAAGRDWRALPRLLDELDRSRRELQERAAERRRWLGRFGAAANVADDAFEAAWAERVWHWMGEHDPEAVGADRWQQLPRSHG
jgi:hypothetical protein